MCSPLKGFLLIVPLKATRDSQRFQFWLCSVQFDSAVWCTLRSFLKIPGANLFKHFPNSHNEPRIFFLTPLTISVKYLKNIWESVLGHPLTQMNAMNRRQLSIAIYSSPNLLVVRGEGGGFSLLGSMHTLHTREAVIILTCCCLESSIFSVLLPCNTTVAGMRGSGTGQAWQINVVTIITGATNEICPF